MHAGELNSGDGMTVDDEAASWLATLSADTATAFEHQQHAAWLALDREHQRAWAQVQATWQLLDAVAVDFSARTPASMTSQRTVPRRRPGRWVAAAAVMLALGLMGGLGWLARPGAYLQAIGADQHTGIGERRSVRLSDGSRVVLNADSAIAIRYNKTRRQVQLLRGEAYFEVVHNPAAPFSVVAADGRITDIGTAFDVRRGPTQVSVMVASGRVAVAGPAGRTVLLGAGEGVRYGASGLQPLASPLADIGAWRDGRLVFAHAPLADVLDQLQAYHHGRVLLVGKALAQRPVTGMFRIDQPDIALADIAQILHLRLVRISPWLVLAYAPAGHS